MKHKSIKREVLVWFGAILFAVLLSFSLLFYYFFNQGVSRSLLNDMHTKAEYIKAAVLPHLDSPRKIDKHRIGYAYAVLKKGHILYQTEDFHVENIETLQEDDKLIFEADEGYQNAIYVMETEKPFQAYIIVVAYHIDDEMEDMVDLLLWIVPILFLLLLWVVSSLIDKVLKPVRALSSQASHIHVDHLVASLDEGSEYRETAALNSAFNTMIARLDQGVSQLNRFNSDVSHELRTPLTAIRGEIETVLRHPRDEAYYRTSMESILYETGQIEAIVENLLVLSKYSKEGFSQSYEVVDLSTLLLNVLEKYEHKIREGQYSIDLSRFASVSFACNKQLIATVFSNLLDNALKYSPEHSRLTLSLYEEDGTPQFCIEDEGVGIPEEDLNKITERFYRVDQSRTRKIKGFGLGLSIVKNILDLHGASLTITSKEGEGSTVVIVFLASGEQ